MIWWKFHLNSLNPWGFWGRTENVVLHVFVCWQISVWTGRFITSIHWALKCWMFWWRMEKPFHSKMPMGTRWWLKPWASLTVTFRRLGKGIQIMREQASLAKLRVWAHSTLKQKHRCYLLFILYSCWLCGVFLLYFRTVMRKDPTP